MAFSQTILGNAILLHVEVRCNLLCGKYRITCSKWF